MSAENSSVRQQHRIPLSEYLLAAMPDELVQRKVMEEKEIFRAQYGRVPLASDRPHIIIASFLAKEMMEETLIRWIQNVCRLQQGFTVRLNNYNGIPEGMIYLRVQDPKPIHQLANAVGIIDGFLQSNECPPVSPVNRPQLPIAVGLPLGVYEKAVVEYAGKIFSESFKVEKLILLKREAGYGTVEILNTFTLLPVVE
jgi:hypothetical protein